MKTLHFGDVTVDRLVEAEGPGFHPAFFMPDATDEAIAAQHDWLLPHFLHAESGRMIQSVHTYVIRTLRHTILVDTCFMSKSITTDDCLVRLDRLVSQ